LLSFSLDVWAKNGYDKLSLKLQNRLLTTKIQEDIALFIYFRDKGEDIEEKLQSAKSALSFRSLQRRVINRGADNAVSFADIPINPEYLNLIKLHASKVRHQIKAINAVSIEATPTAVAALLKYNFVLKIEIVNKLKRSPEPQYNDVTSFSQNNLKSLVKKQFTDSQLLNYGDSFIQSNQLNVPAVHDLGYSGNGVVIAVFDTGFNRLSHESFSQMDIAATWDFVNNDSNVEDQDDMGTGSHGTSTLSALGGYSPGNLIGPAYNATYFLAKTENDESELHVEEDNWCAAAEWADANGAQIISSSLGYTDFDSGIDYTPNDMDGNTTVVTQCADIAAKNGIVVINSAGNNGAGETTLGAPSDGHFVLAVGAVTTTGERSSFSSMGPSADGRIKPDVVAMGSSLHLASSVSDTSYGRFSGTSFSCPLTAGVAALILESNPSLTAAQVRDILRNSADNTLTPNNSYGYGIPDALTAVTSTDERSAPNASFTVTNEFTTVKLSNTSTDSDGTVVSYSWDLGDGSLSTLANLSHTYASAGTYTVMLKVTDNDGLFDEISRTITVTSPNLPKANNAVPNSSSSGGSIGIVLLVGLLITFRKNFIMPFAVK
jgi:subtilisin family serine protease